MATTKTVTKYENEEERMMRGSGLSEPSSPPFTMVHVAGEICVRNSNRLCKLQSRCVRYTIKVQPKLDILNHCASTSASSKYTINTCEKIVDTVFFFNLGVRGHIYILG